MTTTSTVEGGQREVRLEELESATIRLAGDSGDGMQLAGTQFTNTSAVLGNDISTLPDFPAEIRAPAGTLAGVSGFQVHFSSQDIHTPGDQLDALVAMNPAALKTNLKDLKDDGILIVNKDAFDKKDLKKAGYETSPLDDPALAKKYRLYSVPITSLNRSAVSDLKLSPREADRCKNFFALGLIYWLYDRSAETTLNWIQQKFRKNVTVMEANTRTLKAGYNYGETTESMPVHYVINKAQIKPGKYRKITGNEALAMGLVAASETSKVPVAYCSYPITPASDILHHLSSMKRYEIRTLQSEDEIAACCAAIGASFGGSLGVTGTSGPGVCLKSEAIGLAVMTELPLIIIDVQRGGPSTGLPTKTEQADLMQALYGRNGECPVAIVAPRSPGDCFHMAYEAARIAIRFMTPVFVLSDGYLANGAEPWAIPKVEDLPEILNEFQTEPNSNGQNGDTEPKFLPYKRNERLARPWAIPGTAGLEHRIGGIEKEKDTGNVSYDPQNHQDMTDIRANKIANIANDIPALHVHGDEDADMLVCGWGGTYGSILTAVNRCNRRGLKVAQVHFQYLNPMPANTEEVLKRYKKILVPELNAGQLVNLLRAKYLVDAKGLNKVQGKPFLVSEIEQRIEEMLKQ